MIKGIFGLVITIASAWGFYWLLSLGDDYDDKTDKMG